MVSIRELCREFRKKHGINSTPTRLDYINIDFDDIIPIIPNEARLICIGSRPGMGRNALCLDIVLKTALTEKKTVLFFLGGTMFEDSLSLLFDRFLRRLCGANEYSIIKNADSKTICNNTKKIQSALCILERLNIFVDTRKYPTADYIKECISKYSEVGLVVVGNVEYAVPNIENRLERGRAVNSFIEQLSGLTKEINTPIILTTTLSRSVEVGVDKHPYIRKLKYMRLRRFCDLIIMLYRDAYYSLDKDDDSAEVLIAKNSNGNTGWVKMRFDYDKICFKMR